jgi:hypothetical protein
MSSPTPRVSPLPTRAKIVHLPLPHLGQDFPLYTVPHLSHMRCLLTINPAAVAAS